MGEELGGGKELDEGRELDGGGGIQGGKIIYPSAFCSHRGQKTSGETGHRLAEVGGGDMENADLAGHTVPRDLLCLQAQANTRPSQTLI